MRSPFKDIEMAFAPMYDEPIVATTKRGSTQTLIVFIGTDATTDPMSESMLDTDETVITITFRQQDWSFVSDQLKRGDKIERPLIGKSYAVQEVKKDALFGYVATAKEL